MNTWFDLKLSFSWVVDGGSSSGKGLITTCTLYVLWYMIYVCHMLYDISLKIDQAWMGWHEIIRQQESTGPFGIWESGFLSLGMKGICTTAVHFLTSWSGSEFVMTFTTEIADFYLNWDLGNITTAVCRLHIVLHIHCFSSYPEKNSFWIS